MIAPATHQLDVNRSRPQLGIGAPSNQSGRPYLRSEEFEYGWISIAVMVSIIPMGRSEFGCIVVTCKSTASGSIRPGEARKRPFLTTKSSGVGEECRTGHTLTRNLWLASLSVCKPCQPLMAVVVHLICSIGLRIRHGVCRGPKATNCEHGDRNCRENRTLPSLLALR